MGRPHELAITTAILLHLLTEELSAARAEELLGGDVTVTAHPPDRIQPAAEERPQLNLFLYHVAPNLAWRQGAGRSAQSFDLHYVLSAHSSEEFHLELLLGQALAILQRAQRLEAEQLADLERVLARARRGRALAPALAALLAQPRASGIARLEVQPQFLSLDELSRLWSALQARFRPSAAYKVSIVTT